MSAARASIVIPLLHQRDTWLQQSVQSAIDQSVKCEVIVVISLTTPRSNRELLMGLKNVRILERDPIGGFADAVNTGFREAQCERVGLLLSDDWLDRHAVEHTLQQDADIVATGHSIYGRNGKLLSVVHPDMEEWLRLPDLEAKANYLNHFFLFRKTKFLASGGVDPAIGHTGPDDYDLIWTLLESGASVAIVGRPLYCYRDHDDARLTLRDPAEKMRDLSKVLSKHGLSGLRRQRALQDHAVWLGRTIEEALYADHFERLATINIPAQQPLKSKWLLRVSDLHSATGQRGQGQIRCHTAEHEAGHCVYGPYWRPPGKAELNVQFLLELSALKSEVLPLVTIDIYDQQADRILSVVGVTGQQLGGDGVFTMNAPVNASQVLEFRVFWHGRCDLVCNGIRLGSSVPLFASSEPVAGPPMAAKVLTPLLSNPERGRSRRQLHRNAGFAERDYFDHVAYFLRKPYADTCQLLKQGGFVPGSLAAGRYVQVNIYAGNPSPLPERAYFDRALNWHGQDMGMPGLIGVLGLYLPSPDTAIVSLIQSDILQQLFRSTYYEAFKTGMETRFKRWYKMTINAALAFCRNAGVEYFYSPTSETLQLRTRVHVEPALFQRIYDFPPRHYNAARVAINGQDYWYLKINENAHCIAELDWETFEVPVRKRICILHDIEGPVDTRVADSLCDTNLQRMLEIERAQKVRGTYNILGTRFQRCAAPVLEAGRHAIGFHSYNHRLDDLGQLTKVRQVDLQVRGYRPPQSVITEELTEFNLAQENFDWLASSSGSLGFEDVRLESGIVKIPIAIDDYPLHSGEMDLSRWMALILERVEKSDLCVFSLHDCYAQHWIDRYPQLLAQLAEIGEFVNCDMLAAGTFLSSSSVGNPYLDANRDISVEQQKAQAGNG